MEGRASCPVGWGVIPHYLGANPLSPRASSPTESQQPQQNTTTYEPPRGSEEVSEKEVKRKKATTSVSRAQKKQERSERKASKTAHLIQWDPIKADFTGERDKLREKLYGRYDDLGENWINATWNAMTEWGDTHPDEMKAKKDCWLFILGWYMRDAKKERTKKW